MSADDSDFAAQQQRIRASLADAIAILRAALPQAHRARPSAAPSAPWTVT